MNVTGTSRSFPVRIDIEGGRDLAVGVLGRTRIQPFIPWADFADRHGDFAGLRIVIKVMLVLGMRQNPAVFQPKDLRPRIRVNDGLESGVVALSSADSLKKRGYNARYTTPQTTSSFNGVRH